MSNDMRNLMEKLNGISEDDVKKTSLNESSSSVAAELEDIRQQIEDLVRQAEDTLRSGVDSRSGAVKRAKSYWIPHIYGALGGREADRYLGGGSMHTMENTIEELEQEEAEDRGYTDFDPDAR